LLASLASAVVLVLLTSATKALVPVMAGPDDLAAAGLQERVAVERDRPGQGLQRRGGRAGGGVAATSEVGG
jgi:hypothetical protein